MLHDSAFVYNNAQPSYSANRPRAVFRDKTADLPLENNRLTTITPMICGVQNDTKMILFLIISIFFKSYYAGIPRDVSSE